MHCGTILICFIIVVHDLLIMNFNAYLTLPFNSKMASCHMSRQLCSQVSNFCLWILTGYDIELLF